MEHSGAEIGLVLMPDEKPTQKTPNEGYEIPVPTRGEIDRALEQIAKPQTSGKRRRRPKKK